MTPAASPGPLPTSDPDCVFCKILAGQIPATVVAESEHSLAFRDLSPAAPTHVVVIPRRHVVSLVDLAAHSAQEAGDVLRLAGVVAQGAALPAYRLVANTGAEAGQSVFHAHVHVLGGRDLSWPPG